MKSTNLKYKKLAVTGHQRSGTHYITALISLNFLGNKNYVRIYKNHKKPNIARNENVAYIYTFRDFKSVAKSMFVMRKSFGLNNVDTFKNFLKNRYCDMWKPERDFKVNVMDLRGNLRKEDYITGFFSKLKYTPEEWWKIYYKMWDEAEKKKENVIRVSYNDLKNNFHENMLDLSLKLGLNKKSFKNITKKLGWYV